jgi:TRAP-type mannitol/chloroaromatic compound transport system substrate-binding protein
LRQGQHRELPLRQPWRPDERLLPKEIMSVKDVLDLAFKESMALHADINARNPGWKKVYDDMATFRRDQNLWFRFTEAKFDRFMQAQKL